MKRPSWDEMFIKIAETVATRSTCARIQVGCVLVRDNRIISIGYNGSHPEGIHCCDHWEQEYSELSKLPMFPHKTLNDFYSSPEFYKSHHEWAELNELHAEQNMLAFSSKNGIATHDTTLYTTTACCIHCAKLISQAGIKEVKYLHKYDRECEGITFLESCNIHCTEIK